MQAKRGAENAIEHLTDDAIPVLITQARFWSGRPQNSALEILIQAFGGHAIRPVDLPRDIRAPSRAHATRQAKIHPIMG